METVGISAANRLIGEVVQSWRRPLLGDRGVNARLAWCLNSVLNVKAVVAAFNQEKALVGAFSVIVQPVVEPMEHCTALCAGGGLGAVPGLGAGLAARHAALLPREVALP